MARKFRSKLASWVMLAFLGLAIAAMVITGFGTGGVGGLPGGGEAQSETLAEVEGEEIQAAELEQLIRRQLEQARQQNPELDMGRFLAAGAFDGLLNQIVVARAIWAFGQANGLTVSDRMIDRVIANIPEFRNFAGQFDEATFRGALQQQNLSEAQLRREIATFLMQRQVQLPIGLGARVPDSVAVQYASMMLERRRGSIGVVPTDAMAQGIAPTPQEIAAYYQQNRARYTIPERRVLRYALIGRDQVAAAAQPTDAEIQAYYRDNAARYAGQETRTLQQVVLQDEAAARTFVQRAGGGANFAAAAQQANFGASDINLGAQSREQFTNLTNAQVANAVFSAAQGALVGPVRSELGWHVVRIESINRANARPLETVRTEIATELGRRKLQDALGDIAGRLEEKVEDGASFEEIVRAERLTMVETPPITATGQAPGVQYQAPPELQALLRGAFNIDPENPEPAVETIAPNERYAFISVARVVPATVPPLQQIADRVRADVVRQRGSERARALAERIVARINAGVPLARAFAEAGVRLPAPQPVNVRRVDISRREQQAPPPLVMLFSIPQGRARILQAPNGAGWFVVHLEQRTPGQANCPRTPVPAGQQPPEGCQLIQMARAEFSGQAGTEYTEQLARAIQQGVAVERNEQAIRNMRQRLQATTVAP
ncbi:MAG TPA: peptidyl-prolyl cis-trans isomerase [Allosphingosinicella sp.]|jgi:peptidyl-prolyl cis-trans isomerase D